MSALDDIAAECERIETRWGRQDHEPRWWVAILGEEFGEVAKEVAESRIGQGDGDNYRAELVQVAAVAVSAIEAYDRGTSL